MSKNLNIKKKNKNKTYAELLTNVNNFSKEKAKKFDKQVQTGASINKSVFKKKVKRTNKFFFGSYIKKINYIKQIKKIKIKKNLKTNFLYTNFNKKNEVIKKLKLLKILFESKSFYGKLKTKNSNINFLCGTRKKYNIIDLKNTLYFLKKSLLVLNEAVSLKKNILIMGNDPLISFLLKKKYFKNENIHLLNGKCKHNYFTKKSNLFDGKKIDLIVLIKLQSNLSNLLNEINTSKIPVIAVVNTNDNVKSITYPIMINNDNIKSIYSVLYLIRKIIYV